MLIRKLTGACVAASLMISPVAVAAQTTAPTEAPQPADGTADLDAANEAYGYGAIHFLGGAALIALLIYLATKVLKDKKASPG